MHATVFGLLSWGTHLESVLDGELGSVRITGYDRPKAALIENLAKVSARSPLNGLRRLWSSDWRVLSLRCHGSWLRGIRFLSRGSLDNPHIYTRLTDHRMALHSRWR